MGKLVYASNVSLDGCTEDADGRLDWAPPDEEVFAAISDVMRSARTYLYGRRMYETMAVWETDEGLAQSELTAEFARVWQSAHKVVYSTTLDAPTTARTRIERRFDPLAARQLKESADGDLVVGGPTLAAHALAAGLVDELVLFVWPIVLGGVKPALQVGGRADLELVGERRIGSGVMELRYRIVE